MIFFATSFDRTVLEPTIATKHGCQECHNIGHFWPDGSVGECDACHPKHTFDVAVARNPYTCGECHISRPRSAGGGLIAGHQFKRIASISNTCLACHGETVSGEVLEEIRAIYPDDEATGFREGEFRGVVWVEIR